MADKVAGTLSTKIKLDSTEATSSLKELNTSISASVAQMKSLEQQFKSQGDTAGALRSKIEGLGDVQDQLRKKLQTLKNAQQDVADSQGKSSDAYQKLATQITKTETTISRYQTQMDKAKQSLQYYDSGLAELKQSYSDQQRLSQSLVERLRAEGNSYQANVEEINGLKSALSNLKKQYDIQEQELADIAEKSGEASSAYKKQATRLNETATQIAQTESKQKSLTNSLEESTNAAKKSSSGFSSLGTKISDGTSKVSSFTSGIKSTAIGVGLANTAMAAMNLVTGQVGDAVQRVDTLANSKRVFQNMGYSAQDTDKAMKGLNKSIEGLPTSLDEAVQGVQLVASTTGDLQQAQKVWSALNDGIVGFGGSTEQVNTAVQQLSQAFAGGKIDAETWNSMLDAQLGPTLNAIAKDMGMTSAQLKSGLSDGTISVQKFQEELIKLDTQGGGGLKSLSTIAKDSTSGISTAFQNMKTAITRGLGDLITSFSNGLQKITGSNLSQWIAKFGSTTEDVLGKISKALSGVDKDASKIQKQLNAVAGVVKAAFSGLSPIIDAVSDSFKKINSNSGEFTKTLNTLKPVVKAISDVIGNVFGFAIRFTVDLLVDLCKVFNTVSDWISKVGQGFNNFTKNVSSKFTDSWNSMKKGVSAAVKAITDEDSKLHDDMINKISNMTGVSKKTLNDGFKTMEDSVKLFKDFFTGKWDQLGSDVKRLTKDMSTAAKDIFSDMKDSLSSKFNDMKEAISNKANELKDAVKNKLNELKDNAKDKFEDMKESLKSKFEDMKTSLTDKAATLRDQITDRFNTMKDNVKSKIQDLVDSAKTKFTDMYDTLKTKTSEGLENIRKAWEKLWQNIIDGIKSAVKNVGKQVSSLVNNVIKPINKMLDGVKDGVNWVLDKFGADKWSGFKIPEVAFAKGGTVGKGGTMALVNDAPGKNYREMFATPDGRVGAFPDQRNFRTFLPEGTQVLDGENSRALADMMNIPKFADGTEDKSLFEKIFDKAWDIAENIADVIAHPVQFLEKTLTDKIKVNTSVQFASKMAAKAPAYFAKQGMNWLKKMAEDFKKKKEEEVSAVNIGAGASDWTDTIKKVAKAMNVDLSDSNLKLLLKLIQTESGGNQSVTQQISDINSANGDPAKGLLQYTTATFKGYAKSGHTNILSGEDQLYAFFNNSNWASDLAAWSRRMAAGLTGWGPTGSKRYANGGFVDGWTNAIIGEAGPEVVIPLSANKQGRALDLLTTTVNKLNNNAGRSTRVVSGTTSTESDLSAKLDTMIGLLSSILGVNQAQLTKASQKGNLTAFYQRMQRDQAINNYQSI